MKKLRLLITEDCNRSCKGCCNKDWDLKSLPINKGYKGYKEIMLTGGEPMLYPNLIIKICKEIREQTDCPIYLYTAKVEVLYDILEVMFNLSGICLTLHEQKDVKPFIYFSNMLNQLGAKGSFRLNIFKGINTYNVDLSAWKVRKDMVWMKNCPIPKDEVFKRYN